LTVYNTWSPERERFNAVLDEISSRLSSGELSTPPRYSEVFNRGLALLKHVSAIDVTLAKELLRNMVESSVVLLLASKTENDTLTLEIKREQSDFK
jgi:hypothetical protein